MTQTGEAVIFESANNQWGQGKVKVLWKETVDDAIGATSTIAVTSVQIASFGLYGGMWTLDCTLQVKGPNESTWHNIVSLNGNNASNGASLPASGTFYDLKLTATGADVTGSVSGVAHNGTTGAGNITFRLAGNSGDNAFIWSYPYDSYIFSVLTATRTLLSIPVGRLTISNSNTSSRVTRTYSPSGRGSLSQLNSNAYLYYNDTLKIEAWANSGYRLSTLTANNTSISSGGTYTATASVSVVASASAYTASTIAIQSGNRMGSAMVLAITAANTFKHVLTYSFGGLSNQSITTITSGSTTYTWTPPVSLGNQIPNATSGTLTVYLDTYDGTTPVGSRASAQVTLQLPLNSGPVFQTGWGGSAGYTNVNTSASQLSVPVKGYSLATATVADRSKIVAQYGASIYSITASCGGTSATIAANNTAYTLGVISSTTATVAITATDTRGYATTQNLTVSANDYSAPSLQNLTVVRCDNTGTAVNGGTYFKPTFTTRYTALTGNTATVTVKCAEAGGSYGTAQTAVSGVVYGEDCLPVVSSADQLDANKAYTVALMVSDKVVSNVTITVQLQPSVPSFHLMDGGLGAAFGRYAETTNQLDVNWDLKVRGNVVDDFVITGNAMGRVLGLGKARDQIPELEDFNHYTEPGVYGIFDGNVYGTLSNRPSTSGTGGVLRVFNSRGDARDKTSTWYYVAQEYIDRDTGSKWSRHGNTTGTVSVVWRPWAAEHTYKSAVITQNSYTTTSGYFAVQDSAVTASSIVFAQSFYISGQNANMKYIFTIQVQAGTINVYVRDGAGNLPPDGTSFSAAFLVINMN